MLAWLSVPLSTGVWHSFCPYAGVAAQTPPPVAPRDAFDDVHLRGISRWSPRGAGAPALQDWWPAYFLLATAAVLAVLVTLRIVVEVLGPFAHVLVVAGVAAVLTFALAPVVGRLEMVMPRRGAAAVVFFGTLLAILAIAAGVVWQLATEGESFSGQIEDLTAAFQGRRALTIGPYPLPSNLQQRLQDIITTQGPAIAGGVAGFFGALVSSFVDLVLVLVVTFYLMLDARRFRAGLLRKLDPGQRPAARRVFSEVARVFGAYVRAQLIVAVTLGLLVFTAMFAIGVPYALFLGLFAAVTELIPMLGPFIGAIPAILVALTLPFPTVVWVAVAFLVIQQIESNVLLPRLSAHAVGIHPIGSILALVLGFEVGGVVGALFAVPIAGLLWVLASTALDAWRGRRIEIHRAIEERALGSSDGRSRSRARRAVRQLRPRG